MAEGEESLDLDEGGQGGETADTVEEPQRLESLLSTYSPSIFCCFLSRVVFVVIHQKKSYQAETINSNTKSFQNVLFQNISLAFLRFIPKPLQ